MQFKKLRDQRKFLPLALSFLCAAFLLTTFRTASAATKVEELETQIKSHSTEISKLEAEIAKYQKDIQQTGKDIQSLSSKIKTLEATQKKLGADISVTENKIAQSELRIEQLGLQVRGKENDIASNKDALAEAIRNMRETDNVSIVELTLAEGGISNVSDFVQALDNFESHVTEAIEILKDARDVLVDKKDATTKERQNLINLKARLADQKKIAENTKAQQAALLSSTKNQESNYKKLLADRVARKNAFEAELRAFESQLRETINQSKIPAPGTRALNWPVDSVFVTQYFGNTAFARTQAQAYNNQGHNGIDLRAQIGTSIFSSAAGVVMGVGDTDQVCPGASYGKWVLVRHANGLSTLYAHLSLIRVSEGQSVSNHQLLAYSGDTGYVTGPHLHFAVFATEGVQITDRLPSKACGGFYRVPVQSKLGSNLNPIPYLPPER